MENNNYTFQHLTKEELQIAEVIVAARKVQDYLWGEFNMSNASLEEFNRMYRKRVIKLQEIKTDNPYYKVELRKRVLQIAAISVNFLAKLDNNELKTESELPSNLPEYAEKLKDE